MYVAYILQCKQIDELSIYFSHAIVSTLKVYLSIGGDKSPVAALDQAARFRQCHLCSRYSVSKNLAHARVTRMQQASLYAARVRRPEICA